MSEHHMETRRRSRSKTPFLRSSGDANEEGSSQAPQHSKKKTAAIAPNIQTIVEETSGPVRRSQTPSILKGGQLKTKTSDYYSEENSPELKAKKFTEELIEKEKSFDIKSGAMSSSTTYTTQTTKKVIKTSSSGSGSSTAGSRNIAYIGGISSTSTPNQQKTNSLLDNFLSQFNDGRRINEAAQNEINTEYELNQRKNYTTSNINTSMSSSSNRKHTKTSSSQLFNKSIDSAKEIASRDPDFKNHLAYLEYRNSGEYWRKTPKTDYTYSELSQHRRYIAPGVVAMPNMSRRSLHENIGYTKSTSQFAYDSADELDYTTFETFQSNKKFNRTQSSSWFTRFFTTIITTIVTTWQKIRGTNQQHYNQHHIQNDDEPDLFEDYLNKNYSNILYRSGYDQPRGIFGWIGYGIRAAYLQVMKYVYMLIAYVMYCDSLLLESTDPHKRKKRFFWACLFLFPFIVLGYLHFCLQMEDPLLLLSYNVKDKLTELYKSYDMPKLPSLPSLPSLSELPNLPSLPKLSSLSSYMPNDLFDSGGKYEAFKTRAYERFDNLLTWSDDYFLYLKTLSNNLIQEGYKLFQKEENFDDDDF